MPKMKISERMKNFLVEIGGFCVQKTLELYGNNPDHYARLSPLDLLRIRTYLKDDFDVGVTEFSKLVEGARRLGLVIVKARGVDVNPSRIVNFLEGEGYSNAYRDIFAS